MTSRHPHVPTFTPSDIDVITGVSTGLQREWRRQNVLPKKEGRGWTRASLEDVAWMYVVKRLAEVGYPLKEARAAADAAMPFVIGAIVRVAQNSGVATANSSAKEWSNWSAAGNDANWSSQGGDAGQKREDRQGRGYLVFCRAGQGGDEKPVRVIPVDGFDDLPFDLIVWTAMDHHRAAEAILDGVRRVGFTNDGDE